MTCWRGTLVTCAKYTLMRPHYSTGGVKRSCELYTGGEASEKKHFDFETYCICIHTYLPPSHTHNHHISIWSERRTKERRNGRRGKGERPTQWHTQLRSSLVPHVRSHVLESPHASSVLFGMMPKSDQNPGYISRQVEYMYVCMYVVILEILAMPVIDHHRHCVILPNHFLNPDLRNWRRAQLTFASGLCLTVGTKPQRESDTSSSRQMYCL